MGIDPSSEAPPYPPDDAALHHVFDGGWIWVLRFNNGIVSAGVAAEPWLAGRWASPKASPPGIGSSRACPPCASSSTARRPVTPFIHRETLPSEAGRAAGEGWRLLPSAAAFVDPLLSTGFPLTLLGLERLARALERSWGTPAFASDLARDAAASLAEVDTAALLVAALYSRFDDFPAFAELSHLYFASASYAEAARRLGRPELSGAFLSGDIPGFAPGLRECCALAHSGADGATLGRRIREVVAPFDVIGLGDATRRNWYPVLADDLRRSRARLGASEAEIERLLASLAPAIPYPCVSFR